MKIKERLKGIVPNDCLVSLSDRFQVIGDIAIISLNPALTPYKNEIAQAVLSSGKNIHTVLNKTSKLHGEKRVAGFEFLAGRDNTITIHKEFEFRFKLDIRTVFFNGCLGYERMRIAEQVEEGERVLLPFAGVGPFAIHLASHGARVIAIEKSREACRYLQENARLNRVDKMIETINADAFQMAMFLKKDFHRAVIPAPYGRDDILETVLPLVKPGGLLHIYAFKKLQQIETLKMGYEGLGLEVLFSRRCGNVATSVSRWVFDLAKKRDDRNP
jgi:tRNA (guanine37-N1)-methyltransferase